MRASSVVYGPPLGTFSHSYKESHTMLTPEDYLRAGVTEARRDGELLGERRLLEIVANFKCDDPRRRSPMACGTPRPPAPTAA